MLKATNGTDNIYYTRGFELISRREGDAASYYLYDGGLSVRALTDTTGAITDTLVFDAFGNETEKTGTTANTYGFQGEEKDATGLYYLRARYMDPASGTFTSMDTYAGSLSDPMSLHKYLFANSNPIMYSDPSGHLSLAEKMLVCGLIGELASSTLYLVELFTTDNIQYNSTFDAALGSLSVAITGFLAGVLFCLMHILFAAILGTVIAAIVFGSFGIVMSILGIADGFLDYTKGDTTLGAVKVVMSIVSLALSMGSVLNGINNYSTDGIGARNASDLGDKRLYRVMGEGELEAVKKTGMLRGGREGQTYFTDSYYKNANNAKARLSLPQKPKYILEFQIKSNNKIFGGNRVQPNYGENGGGREYYANDIIKVRIVNYQKMGG